MIETTILRLIDGGAPETSDGTGRDVRLPGPERRAFMAGRLGPDGGWAWVAPDSVEARRFLPDPFSLALLIDGSRS